MKLYSLEINGQRVSGYAQLLNDKLWLHLNGQTLVVEDTESAKSISRRRKKLEGRASADHITAPMPGKITKILASEGAAIELGQPLIVMEAMKMEYTLKSEMAGSVTKINVELGQQVSLGEILILLSAN